MVRVKIVLDTRRQKLDGTYSIIFRITDVKKIYTLTSGISILKTLWDEHKREVGKNHPNAQSINASLSKQFYIIQSGILKLNEVGVFDFQDLKDLISDKPKKLADTTFKIFSDNLIKEMLEVGRVGNAVVYQTAVNRFLGFCDNKKIKFTEINYNNLDAFIRSLTIKGLKQNSIGNYLRSLRAIFNKAIKAKVVDKSYYPFNDISIRTEKTQKRAILKQHILGLENLEIAKNTKMWHARNYFLLSFYLIGMSFTDLAYLKVDNIKKERITYKRRKTGKLYDIRMFEKADRIFALYKNQKSKYL